MQFNSLGSASERVVSDDVVRAESLLVSVLEAERRLQQTVAAVL